MTLIDAAVLGFIQGITEFFPVSSSAHLAVAHQLFEIQSNFFFDVFLHLATVCVVLIYFRKRVYSLTFKEVSTLVLATIPAAVIGFLFKDLIESLFAAPQFISIALLVTGMINVFVYFFLRKNLKQENVTNQSAMIIGLAQSLAIFPGITRLGSTTAAALAQGVEKEKAIEFSFLLMIPITLGAVGMQLLDIVSGSVVVTGESMLAYLLGGLIAVAVGLLSIRLFYRIVVTGNFLWVVGYTFIFTVITFFIA